jgi:hypothetical protein
MKNPIFPALIFLTLAYGTVFVIIVLVLLAVRLIPNTRPTTGIDAQAPIFEPVGLIDDVTFMTQSPVSRTVKKPKATLASIVREKAQPKAS